MPKVVFAHCAADRYGSDLQLVESVRAYVDAGWAVVVSVPGRGPLVDLLPEVPVEFQCSAILRKSSLNLRGLAKLAARACFDLVALTRFLLRHRPDLLYVNTMVVPTWVLAAKLCRVPVLVHVHESEEPGRLLGMGLAAPLLLADKVIANSAAARDALAGAIRRLGPRAEVVHNGVADHGALPELGSGPPHKLVYVGRLSPRKGVDVALEAVSLVARMGIDVRLDICGTAFAGYEYFEAGLRRRADRPDLVGRVRFLGYVRPLSEALTSAQILLVPSRFEPFGNIAVEGLLAERAVIAARTQGLREVIIDGATGLLVDPDDPNALASAIERLLRAPVELRALARAGRKDALLRFSVSRYSADVVRAGQSILRDDLGGR
jgi:glycosyltransferase involved in cell wall biosynthesis